MTTEGSVPKASGRRWLTILAPLAGLVAIGALAFFAYRTLVLAEPGHAYPAGWDSWAHLFKAKYLLSEVSRGTIYPALLPWWYDGLEVFRYWSPLPVYVLGGLIRAAGDVFVGGAWLVPLAAAVGGLSWLLYARRIGWVAAIAAGLIWTVWPDHIYLALFEGNLPRVVGTALFPLFFLAFLDSLELKHWPWSGLLVVLLVHVEILCHAMIAAMACIAFSLFAFVCWLSVCANGRDLIRAVTLLAVGVLTSAWWLVPSLQGGLVSMSPAALRDLVGTIPGVFALSDPRGFLVGTLSLSLLLLVGLTWKQRPPLGRAAAICGLAGVLLTVPQIIFAYLVLPFSYLMWPTRYAGLTAVPVILAFVSWRRPAQTSFVKRLAPIGTAVLAAAVVAASLLGTAGLLRRTAEPNPAIQELSRNLAERPGWRLSQLVVASGEVAYYVSDLGHREQVYGFAWQGAKIAPQLVLMDEAMKRGNYYFALDRSWQCGASDVIVDAQVAAEADFQTSAEAAGFDRIGTFGWYTLFSRPCGPQAFVSPYRVVAIGDLAGVFSTMFPTAETGRPSLDSYTVEELSRYDTVVLTGVQWKSKARAEELIRAYAARGGRVVVDLTRFPPDVLSGQPSFLGVSALPLSLETMPAIESDGAGLDLGSLSGEFRPWVTHFLQGLDHVDASFDYFGQAAAVLGSKSIGGRPVTFVGLNLPYHAYLTHDATSLAVLEELTGLQAGATPDRKSLPLGDYRATSSGWSFTVDVPAEDAGAVIILPFAAPDSLTVEVDGTKVSSAPVENLVGIVASPGAHRVELRVGLPPSMPALALVSLTAVVLVVIFAFSERSRRRPRGKGVGATHEAQIPLAQTRQV